MAGDSSLLFPSPSFVGAFDVGFVGDAVLLREGTGDTLPLEEAPGFR